MAEALFPQVGGLLYGGDYNPEQWLDRPDILEEDLRMMKKAHINCVTLGVFSWTTYEPEMNEFHVQWLLDIMDRLYAQGIYTVLATPTAARPAWLDERWKECMRVSKSGVRNLHGVRHNHCITSPAFRSRAEWIIRRLAQAVKGHPGLILWHINNELGGECYCPLCRERFRSYLRMRYHDSMDELNRAWWTTFWSHRYNRFEQIDPPMTGGEGSIMGLNLAWKEFTTWNMADYIRFEREILRGITPEIPATTNFMKLYPGLDYHQLAGELDLIAWDCYPAWHNDAETQMQTASATAFDHAVMRGMAQGKPYMLMESVPSLVNWHPFNKLKRPGMNLLSSLQAIACGSDTVQYFQWRKSRGSYEQYHGAVVDHLGTDDTRVFREVAQTGEALEKLACIAGSTVHADAAVLFSWPNRWAIDNMAGLSQEKKQYEAVCRKQYESLLHLGVEADVISPQMPFEKYQLLIAPMLYLLSHGVSERLKTYVAQGGHLVLTYLCGYVDQDALCYLGGFPGDGLKELAGVCSEEIDTLYPSDRNAARFADGETFEIRDFCEILRVTDARVEAVYTGDFYAETPVVTSRAFGKGTCWYIGARLEQRGMERVYAHCLREAGVACAVMPEGIEHHRREDGQSRYDFYLNHAGREIQLALGDEGDELLTSAHVAGTISLPPFGACVVRTQQGQDRRDTT
ncbi:MAG: beta-galactosidase [bacterium]|nr:beta-galactosidase [bacterium]